MRLKTFAEEHDVSIPLSGPEKTKPRVDNLYDKTGEDFRESWARQISRLNSDLKNEINSYRDKASDPLKTMLDSTTELMSRNQELITDFEADYQ
jgi:hypothetical protein